MPNLREEKIGVFGRRPQEMDLVTSGMQRKLAEGGGWKAGVSEMSVSSFELDDYKIESPKPIEETPVIHPRSKADL